MFVYIAMDDNGFLGIFKEKPTKDTDGAYLGSFSGVFPKEDLPEIKPGECRKFKLAEAK